MPRPRRQFDLICPMCNRTFQAALDKKYCSAKCGNQSRTLRLQRRVTFDCPPELIELAKIVYKRWRIELSQIGEQPSCDFLQFAREWIQVRKLEATELPAQAHVRQGPQSALGWATKWAIGD